LIEPFQQRPVAFKISIEEVITVGINYHKEGMGLVLPAMLNPGLAAVLALGLIGFGIVKLLRDSEDDEVEPPEEYRSKQAIKPLGTVDSGDSVNGATAAGFDAGEQGPPSDHFSSIVLGVG